jgi:hypothetical protein
MKVLDFSLYASLSANKKPLLSLQGAMGYRKMKSRSPLLAQRLGQGRVVVDGYCPTRSI